MHSCLFLFAFVGCDFGDLGGGVRVRTRNTLHEVGGTIAREASDSAVSPRVWGSQKLNHISEPLLHISLFLIIFIIILLFSIDIMHLLRISKKP